MSFEIRVYLTEVQTGGVPGPMCSYQALREKAYIEIEACIFFFPRCLYLYQIQRLRNSGAIPPLSHMR